MYLHLKSINPSEAHPFSVDRLFVRRLLSVQAVSEAKADKTMTEGRHVISLP